MKNDRPHMKNSSARRFFDAPLMKNDPSRMKSVSARMKSGTIFMRAKLLRQLCPHHFILFRFYSPFFNQEPLFLIFAASK